MGEVCQGEESSSFYCAVVEPAVERTVGEIRKERSETIPGTERGTCSAVLGLGSSRRSVWTEQSGRRPGITRRDELTRTEEVPEGSEQSRTWCDLCL